MPRRSSVQREKDLVEISKLYLAGWPQRVIGERLGVTQQQISLDLKVLYKRWAEASVEEIGKLKAKELAKIDNLEREYWEAWERSTHDKETETVKTSEDGKEVTNRTEGQAGDPRFLQGIQWCITQRAKIIGLESGVKNLNVDLTTLSDAQLERLANGEDLFNVLTSAGGG